MPQSGVSGDLPHFPLRDLCLQHDRSHGSDSLSYHPHQVTLKCTTPITVSTAHSVRCLPDIAYLFLTVFRTVNPELKSYALGVLFLLLRLLGKCLHQPDAQPVAHPIHFKVLKGETFGFKKPCS